MLARTLAAAAAVCAAHAAAPPLIGNVSAVYALLERLIPGASSHFQLSLRDPEGACAAGVAAPCFVLTPGTGSAEVALAGSSAAELTAGLGHYFRDYLNFTFGWPRGGGNRVFTPAAYPRPPAGGEARARIVRWSYIMNVCTHSYSLVWYDWPAWERFLDWMALSGINLFLAMTGQEEIQYQVFSKLGVADVDIRSWFNGPAFLTWSRGQNEYGNNIAGPLPRSWMKAQHALQVQILARARSLAIASQLPGFQGNVPIQLKAILSDANITQQGDTGWMYSVDPAFGRIADAWMAQLITDFGRDNFDGTSQWYQMDGYFNGGTAPWLDSRRNAVAAAVNSPDSRQTAVYEARDEAALEATRLRRWKPSRAAAHAATPLVAAASAVAVAHGLPACTWSAREPGYLAGCAQNCKSFPTVAAAQAACAADASCGGITLAAGAGNGPAELRSGSDVQSSPTGETSFVITNPLECHVVGPDPAWVEIGAAAYAGLNRTDPGAVWSFQGWAIIDWDSPAQASSFRGFVDSVPTGKFAVIDMSVDGSGEWQKWDRSSFFGAPFVWTTLHDFGGTDGMKGDLARINEIPFSALGNTTVFGTGYTPEGIDQNPAYYEFMQQQNFRAAPVVDITAHMVLRAHRRYALVSPSADVTAAWTALVNATYAQDLSVQDGTGIPHLPGGSSQFAPDRFTPSPVLCTTFRAWEALTRAAPSVDVSIEPFRYDLVNLGREVLAQLSTPVSQNYSDAFEAATLDAAKLRATGGAYIDLLADVDALVATEYAFLLGPVLSAARAWAAPGDNDCATAADPAMSCADFYEFNARSQLTTWNPTPKGAAVIPGGPIDYASKHWSGLINDCACALAFVGGKTRLQAREVPSAPMMASCHIPFCQPPPTLSSSSSSSSSQTTKRERNSSSRRRSATPLPGSR